MERLEFVEKLIIKHLTGMVWGEPTTVTVRKAFIAGFTEGEKYGKEEEVREKA